MNLDLLDRTFECKHHSHIASTYMELSEGGMSNNFLIRLSLSRSFFSDVRGPQW